MKKLLSIFLLACLGISAFGQGGVGMRRENNLSDVYNVGTSRTNLLIHNATNITAGTLSSARLVTPLQFLGINNGQYLTNLNGSTINFGILPDARLSTNVALKITDSLTVTNPGSRITIRSNAIAFDDGLLGEDVVVTRNGPYLSIGSTTDPYDANVFIGVGSGQVVAKGYVGDGYGLTNVPTAGLTVSQNKLVGRTSTGAGVGEHINIGSGLIMTNGTLAATGVGGEATNVLQIASGDQGVVVDTNVLDRTLYLGTNVLRSFLQSSSGALSNLVNQTSNLYVGAYTGDGRNLSNTHPAGTYSLFYAGALGQSVLVTNVTITNATAELYAPQGNFQVGDVGKTISIWLAGGTNRNLTTTISARTSATQVTLATNAFATATNVIAVYGVDETTNIQAAIDIVTTNASYNRLYVPRGNYLIAGALRDTGADTNKHNAQLYFPSSGYLNGATINKTILIEGVTPAAPGGVGYSIWTPLSEGSSLWFVLPYGATTTTNRSRGLDTRDFSSGLSDGTYYNMLNVVLKNLRIHSSFNNGLRLLDLQGTDNSGLEDVTITSCLDAALPTYSITDTNTQGVVMSGQLNENMGFVNRVLVRGFYYGISPSSAAAIDNLFVQNCYYAVFTVGDVGSLWSIEFANITECKYAFAPVTSAKHIQGSVLVQNYDTSTNQFGQPAFLFDDPPSYYVGQIFYEGNAAVTNNGATNVLIQSVSPTKFFRNLPNITGNLTLNGSIIDSWDDVTNYFAQLGSGDSFWNTNNAAPSSISNTLHIKSASFTGSGAGLTSLTAANIAAGTANINITGNANTATTAATANLGDSATAFFSSGDLEPSLFATNDAAPNLILRATSSTTAKWDAEGGTAGFTNYSYGTEVLNLLDTAGRERVKWQSTSLGNTNTWFYYADGTPMITAQEELAPSLRVLTLYSPSGGSMIEMFGSELVFTGTTTFTGPSSFSDMSFQNATFTNAFFNTNTPAAYGTNAFQIYNSNNIPHYVTYGNNGLPIATNAFGTGAGGAQLAANNAFSGSNNFGGNSTFALPILADGSAVTNLAGNSVRQGTNTIGGATVDFSRGHLVITNMAGDWTITGLANMVSADDNWQVIKLNANGSTRVLTVPADWYVSGFTNNTVVAVTNGTWAELCVSALNGIVTNAAYVPYY